MYIDTPFGMRAMVWRFEGIAMTIPCAGAPHGEHWRFRGQKWQAASSNARDILEAEMEYYMGLLPGLLRSGVVKIEGNAYVGLAADGEWVQIGNVGEERAAEDYLRAHPTPDTW